MLSFFTDIRNDSISSIFAESPTTISYKYINYKTNNTVHQYIKKLTFINVGDLLYSFMRF